MPRSSTRRRRVARDRRPDALLRAVHRRRVRRAGTGGVQDASAPRPRRCSPRSPRRAPPTSTAPSGPRGAAYTRVWSPMSGADRGKYLFRIARILQERAREFAVLETLDNGKPIKESRDVDVPLAAAHFFYHAGWADKLEYAGLGPDPRPLGVVGQVIPWNFPLLMLAWKIAPALACGNTVVLKPAETTPLTALLFAEVCQQADLPPGVVNIVTGAGATGQAIVDHPGHRQAGVHRLDRGRQGDRPVDRRHPQAGHPRARRQGRQHRLRRRPDRPGRRGHRQRHLLQPGPRLLRRLAAARAGVDRRGASSALKRRLATLRVGDPLDKNTDVGAINSAAQLARIRELSRRGEAEGAERWTAPCELPDRGFWFRPTVFTGVEPDAPDRPGGDLRAGPVGAHLPHPAGGGRQGQQHALRPVRRGLDREGLAHPVDGRPAAGRRRVGQHVQQVRPDSPFGGYKESGYGREGGRHGLEAYVTTELADGRRRLDVRKTYKLYIGGAFPRSESGRSYAVRGRRRPVPRQRGAGLPQGRPGRGRRGARGVRRSGPARRRTTAARSSTGSPR